MSFKIGRGGRGLCLLGWAAEVGEFEAEECGEFGDEEEEEDDK